MMIYSGILVLVAVALLRVTFAHRDPADGSAVKFVVAALVLAVLWPFVGIFVLLLMAIRPRSMDPKPAEPPVEQVHLPSAWFND